MNTNRSATPAWIWIATGCLGAVVLFVAVTVGVGFYGLRKAREFQETMKDPVTRSNKARELLGAEALPDGYHAVTAFSLPLLMETVVLSDRPGEPEGDDDVFYQRGFIYTKTLAFGDQERQIEAFFEGETDDAEFLSRTSMGLRRRELVARGSIDEAGRTLNWVAYRGDVVGRRSSRHAMELFSSVLVDCPGDERLRMGIWLGTDPEPATPVAEVDFRGTVADPDEIRSLFAGLDVCGR